MRILISGASVAGPALAYWLTRYGITATVVEKAPAPRKTGGHAVDLFGPAMDIVASMRLSAQVQARKTGTEQLVLLREGIRPVRLEMSRLVTAMTDRHVEIMRDDLAEIFYDATRGDRQQQLLREAYAGTGWEVPRLMAELNHTSSFYFDSITQIQMTTWSRGRVSLVGDAAYCPGPAIGGSTSLAVVGAYVLAGELAAAGGDHVLGFRAYEHELGDYARRSRVFALRVAKRRIPEGRAQLWVLANQARLLAHLPPGVTRALARLKGNGIGPHGSLALKNYRKESGTRSSHRGP